MEVMSASDAPTADAPAPAVPAPARRRGRPALSGARPLSRERIIDAALAMTGRAERRPLTFRSLGERLGVDPSALYRHIRSKDELLLAVADAINGRALQGFERTGGWRADLEDLLLRLFRAGLEHPEVAVAAVVRVTRMEAELRITELMLDLLHEAGVPEQEVPAVYRAVEDTMLAWTGLAAATDIAQADDELEDWARAAAAADPARHPRTVEHAQDFARLRTEDVCRRSLGLLLDGVEAAARPRSGR